VLFSGAVLLEGKLAKYAAGFTALYILVLVAFDARMRTPVPLAMSKLQSKKLYLSGFTLSDKDYHQADKRKLPVAVLNKIGNKTIDVFPWDAAFVLENKLNYAPRPVFQSFSAYTPYLADLNYNYYQQKAPDFVLYDYASIDDRLPFADDCMTQLFVMNNYKLADSFYSNGRYMLLLQRNDTLKKLTVQTLHAGQVKPGSIVDVADAKLVKLDIKPSASAKLNQLLKRQPAVYITCYLSSGDTMRYKSSALQLASGIYTDRYIHDVRSTAGWLSGQSQAKIIKLKVEPMYAIDGDMHIMYSDIH
jgi:hypothetical protein